MQKDHSKIQNGVYESGTKKNLNRFLDTEVKVYHDKAVYHYKHFYFMTGYTHLMIKLMI